HVYANELVKPCDSRLVTWRFIEWYVELPGFVCNATAAYCGLTTSQFSGKPLALIRPPAPPTPKVEVFRVLANCPTFPLARNALHVASCRSAASPGTPFFQTADWPVLITSPLSIKSNSGASPPARV